MTQLLGTTLRQVSAENISIAESILIRAGYLRLTSTGFPVYLHPGQKMLEKLNSHFANEIEKRGGATINLPQILSGDFWQKVNLPASLPFDSRALITHLAAGEISSYRQLPGLFFQINSHSPNPSIEIWGLNADEESSEKQSSQLKEAINQTFRNLGLSPETANGNPGYSHSSRNQDWVYQGLQGNEMYLKNGNELGESASFSIHKIIPPKQEPKPFEKVHTPGTSSIKELAEFLKVSEEETAKVVFYTAKVIGKNEPQLVIAVIRGDMDVSEVKVRNHIKALSLRIANDGEILRVGCVPGFASPININRENVIVIADDLIPQMNNLAAGANETDYHLINTCYGRDYEADIVADIAAVKTDSQSANENSWEELKADKLAQLSGEGSFYSELFNASFMSNGGRPELLHLNYAKIHLLPILLACADSFSDENGLSWNDQVTPYQVSLVSLADGEETVEQAEAIYQSLTAKGISVLYDDRHKKVAGPGVKFKDSDLQGIPLRITVSKRARKEGGLEVKRRNQTEKSIIPIEEIDSFLL